MMLTPEPETLPFPIEVTPAALAQLKRLLAKDGRPDAFLRLGVKGGGCSGFEYVMKLDTAAKAIDLVAEFDGVRVVCDAKSAVFLRGSTFDYTGNLIGGGFRFENPNVAKSCGCGTSFTPKSSG
ncbi:MAG: iron-sulfur cluster assembly accessory protein [Fimbriimonadaceae bacterium]|nr:iron-sulfur cluster assembly accessory protein [Fimbriimonadaceae bacterium]